MKITVIIPTLNEELYLGNLLDSLKVQTRKPNEIIVIDAGSKDQTLKIADKYKVNIVNSKPPVGYQRNQAGKIAKGDLLVYLDADSVVKPDFLQKVEIQYTKKKFSIACPYYFLYKSRADIKLFFVFLNLIFFLTQKLLPSGAGICIVIEKKAFMDSKGFDKDTKFDDIKLIRDIAKRNKFRMLPIVVFTSDRRFIKYGVFRTMFTYILLSIIFSTNLVKLANKIKYEFGEYNNNLSTK